MKNKTALKGVLIGILFAATTIYCNLKPDTAIDFSADVKPILNKHCISCHGGVKQQGGFNVLFETTALQATASGKPAIIPGNARKSELIQRLHHTDLEMRMPYQKPALSKREIKILTDWVNQGAKWGTHWAYIPPQAVIPPKVNPKFEELKFLSNPIDNFIAAQMEGKALLPNPPASKNNIARRVAFDITGLPPDTELFQAFTLGNLNYESLIDSLFNSKRYGEKWASWWLDMARYADSKGFEKDPERIIWEYRDWVIRALNQDLPYDQFTLEQLAGDLLPDPKPEQLIATAFHRNTMNNDEGGTDDEEYRVAAVIDRVNTTFDVWQSTTMSCVQCHSHRYDPLLQKEYYQIMAFFNNTRDEDVPDDAPNLIALSPEDEEKANHVIDWIKANTSPERLKQFKDFIRYKEPKYQSHQFKVVKHAFVSGPYLGLRNQGAARMENISSEGNQNLYFKLISHTNSAKLIFRKGNSQGPILGTYPLRKNGANAHDSSNGQPIVRIAIPSQPYPFDLYVEVQATGSVPKKELALLQWIAFLPDLPGKGKSGFQKVETAFMEVLNASGTPTPIMVENPNHMQRKTHVFDRGNWLVKNEEVQPGVPHILNPWQDKWEKNRMGLARWLVSKQNPLTARTLVNRVWYQLFGQGLVPSLEDMGTMSDPPSHPALLDWLSYEFMYSMNWSLKTLIKTILMSSTYQQSAKAGAEKLEVDIKNTYYSRGPRLRLSAEEIRDQALYVSGLLSHKMYGPGVMPPQPEGIWEHVYLGNLWKESQGEDKYRRGIYTYLKRTSPYPSLITFDAGSREVCTVRRSPTNTPLQALVTLNDPVFLEAALVFANNYKHLSAKAAILTMYEKATYRNATNEKMELLFALYQDALREFENSPDALEDFFGHNKTPNTTKKEIAKEVQNEPINKNTAALAIVANAIMNLDEFLTHG